MNREEELALVVWLIAVEVQQAKEEILTTLDEAVTRIQTDIANAVSALGDVKAARDALAAQGADVSKLNTAADQVEAALSNVGPTLGQVSTPPAEQPPADTGTGGAGTTTSGTSSTTDSTSTTP